MQLEVVRKGTFHHGSPPGNGCRPVRSLSESGSGSGSESRKSRKSIPVLIGTWPLCTAQTLLSSCVGTPKIRLRYPVSHVRIPSRVPAIPRPIATPTPILLRNSPFRTASSSDVSASAPPYTPLRSLRESSLSGPGDLSWWPNREFGQLLASNPWEGTTTDVDGLQRQPPEHSTLRPVPDWDRLDSPPGDRIFRGRTAGA